MNNDLPPIGQKEVDIACRILVIALVDSNAGKMKITQEKFHDRKGNILGDFQIVVKKIK
jgi:hypothetical protein